MKKLTISGIHFLLVFTFCFVLFSPNAAVAQIQDDIIGKGTLPNQMYDTRTLSMAGTTIADVFGKPSMGVNSALSGLFSKPSFIQVNTNHNWDSNFLQHNLVLPTLSTGLHNFTGRFSYYHQGFDNLPFTSSATLPDPNIVMYRAELGYAIAISNHFSVGTLQSVSYTTTDKDKQAYYWNYFADIGLVYAPEGPVSYGMVFRGLGHKTTYEIIETGQTTLDSRLARQILEVGATLRYPIEERTYLSISFANEKRFGEDGLWYKGGVEITPIPLIDIRGGAMVNFDKSDFIPRVGIGINASIFRIDYMIAPNSSVGEHFHQFGLTFQF